MKKTALAIILLIMAMAVPSVQAWNPNVFVIKDCINERDAAQGLIGTHSGYVGVVNPGDLKFTNSAAGSIIVNQDGSFEIIPPAGSNSAKRTSMYYKLERLDGRIEGHMATFIIYPCSL